MRLRHTTTAVLLMWIGTLAAGAQERTNDSRAAPGIVPSGLGASVDGDVTRARAATARFRDAAAATRAGYPAVSNCVEHQPHGAMGLHYTNEALLDATLDVERPEVLVYERLPDDTIRLNGVEYVVPMTAWKETEAPVIMGQKLKRAERLGIWYLHVWIWERNPSGLFADWNPNVKCSTSRP